MKLFLAALIAAIPAYCQLFSIGAKAGVPLADAYSDVGVADGASFHSIDRYTIGPTFELHLLFHLSIEVDALYRRSDFGVTNGHILDGTFNVNDWQVPVLAKYGLPLGISLARPFVDGGLTYRHVSSPNSTYPALNPNNAGITFGGGITLKLLNLRLSPEIRYTHWPQTAFNNGAVVSTNNQADFLVGFTF